MYYEADLTTDDGIVIHVFGHVKGYLHRTALKMMVVEKHLGNNAVGATRVEFVRKRYFNVAHFPVGTKCVVSTSVGKEVEVEVSARGVSTNGPHSWVLHTTTPGKCTEFEAYNLQHVTSIVKRGSGPLVVDAYLKYTHPSLQLQKPKTSYVGSLCALVSRGLNKQTSADTWVDGSRLIDLLQKQGVFSPSSVSYIFFANKKRLHRAIKQNLGRCCVNRRVAQSQHDALDDEAMCDFFDDDLDRRQTPYVLEEELPDDFVWEEPC